VISEKENRYCSYGGRQVWTHRNWQRRTVQLGSHRRFLEGVTGSRSPYSHAWRGKGRVSRAILFVHSTNSTVLLPPQARESADLGQVTTTEQSMKLSIARLGFSTQQQKAAGWLSDDRAINEAFNSQAGFQHAATEGSGMAELRQSILKSIRLGG
jgi:hypothetical protein